MEYNGYDFFGISFYKQYVWWWSIFDVLYTKKKWIKYHNMSSSLDVQFFVNKLLLWIYVVLWMFVLHCVLLLSTYSSICKDNISYFGWFQVVQVGAWISYKLVEYILDIENKVQFWIVIIDLMVAEFSYLKYIRLISKLWVGVGFSNYRGSVQDLLYVFGNDIYLRSKTL